MEMKEYFALPAKVMEMKEYFALPAKVSPPNTV